MYLVAELFESHFYDFEFDVFIRASFNWLLRYSICSLANIRSCRLLGASFVHQY